MLLSISTVSACATGRNQSEADTATPGGGAGSPTADDVTRTPVPAECPAMFDPMPPTTEKARRAVFVPPDATGATLCRYFEHNDVGAIPLVESSDLAGAPGALIQFLNSLPDYSAAPESTGSDGIPVTECTSMLVPTFYIVLHYAGSLNILVRADPSCRSVTSDGDGRALQHVDDLLHYWGLDD